DGPGYPSGGPGAGCPLRTSGAPRCLKQYATILLIRERTDMKTGQRALIGFLMAAAYAGSGGVAIAQTAGSDAAGAQVPTASQFPCEQEEKFREFDFWVGEWDVHTPDGKLAGRNVVEVA